MGEAGARGERWLKLPAVDVALADSGATRKAAGDWIVNRAREFGEACIHRETGPTGHKQRAERAWQEYLRMPGQIYEWGRRAMAAE